MKLRQKIVLACAGFLCGLFFIGESNFGQDVLRGTPNPKESHFEVDDRYMGAGLAPFVHCLAPGILLLIYWVGDILIMRAHRRN